MRVDMNISESIKEPYAVINSDELTPEIAALAREIAAFGNGRNVIMQILQMGEKGKDLKYLIFYNAMCIQQACVNLQKVIEKLN